MNVGTHLKDTKNCPLVVSLETSLLKQKFVCFYLEFSTDILE